MTRAATILTSLLSAIIGGLIVGGLLLFFTLNSDTFQSLKPVKNGAGAGYKILTDFECRYGQTKHILMNGVDDNFALDKPEPSRRHPRLAHLPGLPFNMPYKRDYDEMGRDKVLVDYFEVPPRVERGLFVTRLEHSDNYENDYLIIGDAWEDSVGLRRYGRHLFNVLLNEIDTLDGWTHSAKNIYSARLRDIKFRDKNPEVGADYQRLYKNLLQLIQSQDKEGVIDVMVADDTTADFMGLAICTEPENNKGLTFALVKQVEALTQNFQLIGCDLEPTSIHCNPYYGDTLCSESLPLACTTETGGPAPDLSPDLPIYTRLHIQQFWGVGDIKFSQAIKGEQFETLSDANAYCAQSFGADWRVLDYHDGGVKAVSSRRADYVPNSRVWVDIKDQPNGTCWARDDARPSDQSAQNDE